MADLPTRLVNNNGVYLDKDTKINCMWADDIILLSEEGNRLHNFCVGDKNVENVCEYKYLGLFVLFTPSGKMKSVKDDLRSRALKAYWLVIVIETMNLFETLVRPILTYSSDFSGCLKLPNNNPVENVHTMFCKHLLGVNKQTTNYGIWLELGRTPLNPYLQLSYKNAQDESLIWLSGIAMTLVGNGADDHFSNNTEINTHQISDIFSQRLMDIFH